MSKEKANIGPWTRNAIEHGGILTIQRSQWKIKAEMNWPLLQDIEAIESEEKTISKALECLEEYIQEDAADEMIEAGVA